MLRNEHRSSSLRNIVLVGVVACILIAIVLFLRQPKSPATDLIEQRNERLDTANKDNIKRDIVTRENIAKIEVLEENVSQNADEILLILQDNLRQ